MGLELYNELWNLTVAFWSVSEGIVQLFCLRQNSIAPPRPQKTNETVLSTELRTFVWMRIVACMIVALHYPRGCQPMCLDSNRILTIHK